MTNSWFKENLLCSTIVAGLVAGMSFSVTEHAWAQDADDDSQPAVTTDDGDDGSADADERLIVTGSRLRRSEFDTASPIQIIDGETARDLGLIDAADLLQRRAALLPRDSDILNAYDPYTFIRDAWLQNREYRIFDGNPPEPDYDALLEDWGSP